MPLVEDVNMWPVKPDASPEEVRAVVNDDSGNQIFSQAVRLLLDVFQDSC